MSTFLALIISATIHRLILSFCGLYQSASFFSLFNPSTVPFYSNWPSGAWLVGSTYMIWSMGAEILDGHEAASHTKKE
jgi:hypothetical protein